MKLYLSSYQYGDEFEKYLEMVGEGGNVAVIDNSRDGFDETRKDARTQECIEHLGSLGLDASKLDLRNYFGKKDELANVLSGFGGIWLLGGNAFVLRKAYEQTGLNETLPELLNSGLAYGGFSAAGCVLSPSLRGIELVDDVHLHSDGYTKETIWEGLGVLDYAFVPHYKSDHPESADVDKYVEYLEQHNMPYRTLHDGEAIVVDE